MNVHSMLAFLLFHLCLEGLFSIDPETCLCQPSLSLRQTPLGLVAGKLRREQIRVARLDGLDSTDSALLE